MFLCQGYSTWFQHTTLNLPCLSRGTSVMQKSWKRNTQNARYCKDNQNTKNLSLCCTTGNRHPAVCSQAGWHSSAKLLAVLQQEARLCFWGPRAGDQTIDGLHNGHRTAVLLPGPLWDLLLLDLSWLQSRNVGWDPWAETLPDSAEKTWYCRSYFFKT